jgi:hypothetical protein
MDSGADPVEAAASIDLKEWEHDLIRKVLCVTLDALSRSTKF